MLAVAFSSSALSDELPEGAAGCPLGVGLLAVAFPSPALSDEPPEGAARCPLVAGLDPMPHALPHWGFVMIGGGLVGLAFLVDVPAALAAAFDSALRASVWCGKGFR